MRARNLKLGKIIQTKVEFPAKQEGGDQRIHTMVPLEKHQFKIEFPSAAHRANYTFNAFIVNSRFELQRDRKIEAHEQEETVYFGEPGRARDLIGPMHAGDVLVISYTRKSES